MNNKSSGGIGFCGVLGIVFIVLKLTGAITWSWVWVLSPLWISMILVIALIILLKIAEKQTIHRWKKLADDFDGDQYEK